MSPPSREIPTLAIVTASATLDRAAATDAIAARARALAASGVGPGVLFPVLATADAGAVVEALAARACGAAVMPVAVAAPPSRPARLPAGAAWAVATSGTTGRPRTVALTAEGAAFVAARTAAILGLGADDAILCGVPWLHSYGLSQVWLAAQSGATLVLAPAPLLPADLRAWCAQATLLAAVPFHVERIVAASTAGTLGAVRALTLAGQATLPPERAALHAALPAVAKHVFYGLTEATSRVLALPPAAFLAQPQATGDALHGVETRLGERGELQVRGPNLSPGDVGGRGPRTTADGWLCTGDRFTSDGGRYTFVGRLDRAVKRHGEKVHPEVVEAALRAIPGVRDAHVTPRARGSGEPELLARVVAEGVEPGALRRACKRALPAAAVPSAFELVEALPRTPAGKLRRE